MKEKTKSNINYPLLKVILFLILDCAIIFLSYFLGVLVEYDKVSAVFMLFIAGVIVFKSIMSFIVGNYRMLTSNF